MAARPCGFKSHLRYQSERNVASEAMNELPQKAETPSNVEERVLAIIEQKYRVSAQEIGQRMYFLAWLRLFSPESIAGKRILDLGCGSTWHPRKAGDHRLERTYEPWLCRLLHEAGAHPIGVDIGNLEGEEFEHYERDLTLPDALSMIEDDSMDGVHASSFSGMNPSPTLEVKNRAAFDAHLRTEALRVLKERGVFYFDALRFLKHDGKFVLCDSWADLRNKREQLLHEK